MKTYDFIIILGALNDSIAILKHLLKTPDQLPAVKNFLQLKYQLVVLYQSQLESIFQDESYLHRQDKLPIIDATNILEIEIENDIYTAEINKQTKKLLSELIEINLYGNLFKAVQQARTVIYELITTEADFINACRKIAGSKKLLIKTIEEYANFIAKNNFADKLTNECIKSCINAFDHFDHVQNCFCMNYQQALQSTNQFESIIHWLYDHFISTDFANYYDEKLSKMIYSFDMLHKLFAHIKTAGSNNCFNLSEEQKSVLALVESELSKPFQRSPRYVLLVKEVEKTIQSFNELPIPGISEKDNVKLLEKLVSFVECKTAKINQLISLRDYSENLSVNVLALSTELSSFVKENSQLSFFTTNQKLLRLEVGVARSLISILNVAILNLSQLAEDNQTKLDLLESMAKLLLQEMRNKFKSVDDYLIDQYKNKKIQIFSGLEKILTPFIAKFQQISADDKKFLQDEWAMGRKLEEDNKLIYGSNFSRSFSR